MTESDVHEWVAAGEDVPYSPRWFTARRQFLGEAACRQLGFYELPEDFLLSVVIPVFNEEQTLRDIVGRVSAVELRKEIVLVDDCSRGRSREIMQELAAQSAGDPLNRIVVLAHERNRGKGAALRTGFEKATGNV